MIPPFLVHLLILTGIYFLVAISMNLLLGYSRLLNLGQIALFGIGAYTSALLNINGLPFIFSILAAGVVTSIFGLLLILAAARLKEDYFALATLGFSFVIFSLLLNVTSLTNGPIGIIGIQKPTILGFEFSGISFLLLVSVIVIITLYGLSSLINSKIGKSLHALRDNELRLKSLGINTSILKYKITLISSFITGIAGSLFAHYIGFIDPTAFLLSELILILSIVVIGGIASIWGTLLASVLIIFFQEFLRFIPFPATIIGPVRQMLFGILIIIILIIKPKGLLGEVDL